MEHGPGVFDANIRSVAAFCTLRNILLYYHLLPITLRPGASSYSSRVNSLSATINMHSAGKKVLTIESDYCPMAIMLMA